MPDAVDSRSHACKRTNIKRIQQLTEEMESDENDLMNFWRLSPDMFAIISREGKFLEFNNSWLKTLELSREEIISGSITSFAHHGDIDQIKSALESMSNHKIIRFHCRYKKKSGYVTLELSATQWYNNKSYVVARLVPSSCISCPDTTSRFSTEVEQYA